MNSTWFDATVAWIPGTLLGVAGGTFGALVGFARMSESRSRRWFAALWASYWAIVCVSAIGLTLAVAAFCAQQPRVVWYALLQPGVLGTCLFGPLCFQVLKTFPRDKKGLNPSREPAVPTGANPFEREAKTK